MCCIGVGVPATLPRESQPRKSKSCQKHCPGRFPPLAVGILHCCWGASDTAKIKHPAKRKRTGPATCLARARVRLSKVEASEVVNKRSCNGAGDPTKSQRETKKEKIAAEMKRKNKSHWERSLRRCQHHFLHCCWGTEEISKERPSKTSS